LSQKKSEETNPQTTALK